MTAVVQPPHDPQHNPYRPPEGYLPSQGAPVGHPAAMQAGEKPKWFMFAMVGTMVLGGLGVIAGLWAPVNLLMADQMQQLFTVPGAGGAMPEMQQFQREVHAASMPGLVAGLGLLNLVSGAWALWAAIKLVKLSPGARRPFRNALAAVAGYEIVAVVVTGIVQVRMWSVMERFTDKVMHTTAGGASTPDVERMMQAVMGTAMVAGAVFAVLWAGCKIAFALWARSYVDKADLVAYAGD